MAPTYPWLVHSHGKNNRIHTFTTITSPNDSYIRRFPHSKHGKFWVSCNDGWSLSSDAIHRNFFLWNIAEAKRITLPPLMDNFEGSFYQCTITSDSRILLTTTDRPLIFSLCVGDKQWTVINYKNELIKCLRESGEVGSIGLFTPLRIFSCNGDLYAQTRNSRLLVIEKLEPNHGIVLKSLRLNFPKGCGLLVVEERGFLAEFEGRIYWILFRFDTIKEKEEVVHVDVHGLDVSNPKMGWEKIEHAPHLVFFVHETCSFCCRAIEQELHGNRIYFSSEKILYSYNIGDNTLSAHSSPLPNIKSSYSLFWIMPDQSIAALEGEGEKYNTRYLPLDVACKVADRVDNISDFLRLRASHRMFRSVPVPLHLKQKQIYVTIQEETAEEEQIDKWFCLSDDYKTVGPSIIRPDIKNKTTPLRSIGNLPSMPLIDSLSIDGSIYQYRYSGTFSKVTHLKGNQEELLCTQLPPMLNRDRKRPFGVFAIAGKIYIFGGGRARDPFAEVYDPLVNQWVALPNIPQEYHRRFLFHAVIPHFNDRNNKEIVLIHFRCLPGLYAFDPDDKNRPWRCLALNMNFGDWCGSVAVWHNFLIFLDDKNVLFAYDFYKCKFLLHIFAPSGKYRYSAGWAKLVDLGKGMVFYVLYNSSAPPGRLPGHWLLERSRLHFKRTKDGGLTVESGKPVAYSVAATGFHHPEIRHT